MPLVFNAVPEPIDDLCLLLCSENNESKSGLLPPKGIFSLDKKFRIVEIDTLIGTFFALALVMELGHGSYKIDGDFPVRISEDSIIKIKEVIGSLSEDHIEYGYSAGSIKESLLNPYLVETDDGFYSIKDVL